MKKLLTIFVCLFISVSVFSQGGVVSSHNLPASVAPGQTIDVDFTLNKGSIGGFAKFQMDLPFGFNATNVDSKSGNFTFENQRVKIVWVSIPAEVAFTFKFKISVPANALNVCSVSAKFFYLENNVKKEVEMPVHNMKISSDVASTPTNTVTSTPTNTVSSTPTNTVATTPTNTVSSTPTNTVATTPTNTVSSTPTNTVATTPTNTVATTPTNTVSTTPTNTVTTAKNTSGTVYRIQLGAFSSSPAKSKFPGVNLSVVEEGGFYKALSGNFNTLEQAQKHKSDLEAKGYSGFIVTYQNGQRTGIIK